MSNTKRIAGILNNVMQICAASKQGYQNAADHVQDVSLHEFFLKQVELREGFERVLSRQIIALNVAPAHGSGVLSALHRGWMDMRLQFQNGGDRAIVEECLRGEEIALKHYLDAMSANLHSGYHNLLLSQYKQVRDADDYLRDYHTRSTTQTA